MPEISRREFARAAGLAAVGAGTTMGQNQSGTVPDVRVERDIVFGHGGDLDLRLDVYHPPATIRKRVAVIHVHGGGFTRGSKDSVQRAGPFYASLGYVAIASQYRLADQGDWPAQLHDVKAAIRWARAHTDELGIDPEGIAIAGYSAGGLMAMFAAATPDRLEFEGEGGTPGVSTRVAACIGYYPATSTPDFLLPDDVDPAGREAANLANWTDERFAPTILFHGTADEVISPANTQQLVARLQDLNVPVELHTFDGQPHIFDRDPVYADVCARLANIFVSRQQ